MIIDVWRDPYYTGSNLTKPKSIKLNEGITVLVGCNGAGKTTLLNNIDEFAKRKNIPCDKYDNLVTSKNGIGDMFGNFNSKDIANDIYNLMSSSEGESIKLNITRHSKLYNDFLTNGEIKDNFYEFRKVIFGDQPNKMKDNIKRLFLFDATDSGLSIDSVCEIKEFLNNLLNTAKEMKLEPYIIISSNEYELCRNSMCFDVTEGCYVSFTDYDDYRKFIINSRDKKDKRIEKEIEWVSNQIKKEEDKYTKLKDEIFPIAIKEDKSFKQDMMLEKIKSYVDECVYISRYRLNKDWNNYSNKNTSNKFDNTD